MIGIDVRIDVRMGVYTPQTGKVYRCIEFVYMGVS
jgi:hypothetical protein